MTARDDKWDSLLTQAAHAVCFFANPNINVVRLDEAKAILRNAIDEPHAFRKIVCHAEGDKCLGCDHYAGKADRCSFTPSHALRNEHPAGNRTNAGPGERSPDQPREVGRTPTHEPATTNREDAKRDRAEGSGGRELGHAVDRGGLDAAPCAPSTTPCIEIPAEGSGELRKALDIILKLASIINATPAEAFKGWSMGERKPYELAMAAEAFVAVPRVITGTTAAASALSAIARTHPVTMTQERYEELLACEAEILLRKK